MLAFDPVLLTGVQEIDDQHRELFVRVDRLLEASRARRGRDEVAALLEFLASYVVEHFASEEGRMAAARYPELEAHVEDHRQFASELEVLHREVRSDGPTPLLVIRVGTRVTEWLRDHIYRTDRAFGEWLRASGAAG